MITSKEDLHTELQKVRRLLTEVAKKAYEEAFEEITHYMGVNPYHKQREAEEAYAKRLLALPPNLRSAVCGGIEISLAEKVFEDHGRDLTDHEFDMIRFALREGVVLSGNGKMVSVYGDDLRKMSEAVKRSTEKIKELDGRLIPQPTKRTPKGIPWNKKRDFKRPK